MRRGALGTLVCLDLVVGGRGGVAGGGGHPTAMTALAVERWAAAVQHHTPGDPDAAVALVWALSPDARKALTSGLDLFLSTLRSTVGGKVPVTTSPEEARI